MENNFFTFLLGCHNLKIDGSTCDFHFFFEGTNYMLNLIIKKGNLSLKITIVFQNILFYDLFTLYAFEPFDKAYFNSA